MNDAACATEMEQFYMWTAGFVVEDIKWFSFVCPSY